MLDQTRRNCRVHDEAQSIFLPLATKNIFNRIFDKPIIPRSDDVKFSVQNFE